MARSLNSEEAEIFKNVISPERKFTEDFGSFDGLPARRDEELELIANAAFWLGGHIPGATNT